MSQTLVLAHSYISTPCFLWLAPPPLHLFIQITFYPYPFFIILPHVSIIVPRISLSFQGKSRQPNLLSTSVKFTGAMGWVWCRDGQQGQRGGRIHSHRGGGSIKNVNEGDERTGWPEAWQRYVKVRLPLKLVTPFTPRPRPSVGGHNLRVDFLTPWMVLITSFLCFPEG